MKKELGWKDSALLFSSPLFLQGTSQIAFDISDLIKLSSGKKSQVKLVVLLIRYSFSLIKEEIISFDLMQTLSEVKNTFKFEQALLGCKFISWNVIRFAISGQRSFSITPEIIKKPLVF